jgi:hypothetical protein
MDFDDSDVARLLRGGVPIDDPVWGEVSGFLDSVGTAYPAVPTATIEDRHLAAVASESALVQQELRDQRQGALKRLSKRSHRILAGSVGAVLIVLTAGVGVASALGINPIEQLLQQVFPTAVAPQATTPGTTGSQDPASASPRGVPGSTPNVSPSSGVPEETTKADQKAAKEAELAAKKAAKKAELAAKKAAKEAEQAAKKAAKEAGKPTPTPSPGTGHGKKGNGVGDQARAG